MYGLSSCAVRYRGTGGIGGGGGGVGGYSLVRCCMGGESFKLTVRDRKRRVVRPRALLSIAEAKINQLQYSRGNGPGLTVSTAIPRWWKTANDAAGKEGMGGEALPTFVLG